MMEVGFEGKVPSRGRCGIRRKTLIKRCVSVCASWRSWAAEMNHSMREISETCAAPAEWLSGWQGGMHCITEILDKCPQMPANVH